MYSVLYVVKKKKKNTNSGTQNCIQKIPSNH